MKLTDFQGKVIKVEQSKKEIRITTDRPKAMIYLDFYRWQFLTKAPIVMNWLIERLIKLGFTILILFAVTLSLAYITGLIVLVYKIVNFFVHVH